MTTMTTDVGIIIDVTLLLNSLEYSLEYDAHTSRACGLLSSGKTPEK